MDSSAPILKCSDATKKIKEKVLGLGFDLVGITSATSSSHHAFFEAWLDKGYAGEMLYLEKGRQKRGNPQLILSGAKSMICCALNYYTGEKSKVKNQEMGKISNYGWGKDYHKVVLTKLEEVEKFIHESISPIAKTKSYVDTGPILERSYAQRAGLGWIGKNTLLIHPQKGSFLFLGEILTDLELVYDAPFNFNHCGTCKRCLDACPTQAFKGPGVLDARACISYWTLEHRGVIPPEQRSGMGDHLAGCDICQEVCPWNRDPIVTSVEDFFPRESLNEKGPGTLSLEKISEFTPEEFQTLFFESPLKRLKYEGLLRNAVIVMGNSGEKEFLPTLKAMKEKIQNIIIQEHVDWAIRKLSII
ncbi:MAG: tRNA epoxyqueuosine(34) reductase QueG [Chlamydiae bacterium]|nr:tRNA epoxyqueuosine(34) reductase QueG [Chlamydiota bacterium]MBI3277520.1 tRNA epoxyqueuosine(34) reductase QueG [Chlamydiota bacterium]